MSSSNTPYTDITKKAFQRGQAEGEHAGHETADTLQRQKDEAAANIQKGRENVQQQSATSTGESTWNPSAKERLEGLQENVYGKAQSGGRGESHLQASKEHMSEGMGHLKEGVGEKAEQAQQSTGGMYESARLKASEAYNSAAQSAHDASVRTSETIGSVAGKVTGTASSMAERAKEALGFGGPTSTTTGTTTGTTGGTYSSDTLGSRATEPRDRT